MSQTETSNSYPTSARNQVKRRHDRGFYDHATVHRILDSSMLCHVSYVIDGWHGTDANPLLRRRMWLLLAHSAR